MNRRNAMVVVALTVLGLSAYTALSQPAPKPAPAPPHQDIVALHNGHNYAAASTHNVAGKSYEVKHVTSNKVPGAKVGQALPKGHYPLAQATTPAGGGSKELGAGTHHFSLKHENGKWHVYAATAGGKVVHTNKVFVSDVKQAKTLPASSVKHGSMSISLPFPFGTDPATGATIYAYITFTFD